MDGVKDVQAAYDQAARDRVAALADQAPKLEEPLEPEALGPFWDALVGVVGALAPDLLEQVKASVPRPAAAMTSWDPALWSLVSGVAAALAGVPDIPRLSVYRFDPRELTRNSLIMDLTAKLKPLVADTALRAEAEAAGKAAQAKAAASPPSDNVSPEQFAQANPRMT